MSAASVSAHELWAGPIALVDVEVSAPARDLAVDTRYERVLLRLREQHRPVGRVELSVADGRLAASEITQAIASACPPGGWPAGPAPSTYRPDVTVAVCTRGRDHAVLATIAAFEQQTYDGPLEIVVVENVPGDDSLRRLLAARPQRPERPLRYASEPIGGLSRARNRATATATGELIAFTDDDAVAEPQWVEAIVAGFAVSDRVGAVSGLTVAAEIETQAQEWCERFDGFNRGRGFQRMVFSPRDPGTHVLYPVPMRGAGVNMAFRRDLLRAVGGCSPALGAGTQTRGAEDTAVLAEILLSGHDIAYEPAAVVRHSHRRSEAELMKMLHDNGTGATAYFSWCLHHHPIRSMGLARAVPAAARYFASRGGSHHSAGQPEVPAHLRAELRRGMVEGPGSYVRAVRDVRRLTRSEPHGQSTAL